MRDPIFIVGPHRAGSTLWHNLVAMCPNVMRLAEPRFLAPPRQRDFNFFLKSQARDLSTDKDVETLVELCFSRKRLPGLDSAFWRFESIAAPARLRAGSKLRIAASERSRGSSSKKSLARAATSGQS
jgi:hypothetical protein